MKKKVSQKTYKKYITDLVQYMQIQFFLEEYRIDIIFKNENSNDNTVMKIIMDCDYLNFAIEVYPSVKEKFEQGKLSEIEEILVHEFCHLLFQPYRDMFSDFISPAIEPIVNATLERQVQRTANVILNYKGIY